MNKMKNNAILNLKVDGVVLFAYCRVFVWCGCHVVIHFIRGGKVRKVSSIVHVQIQKNLCVKLKHE